MCFFFSRDIWILMGCIMGCIMGWIHIYIIHTGMYNGLMIYNGMYNDVYIKPIKPFGWHWRIWYNNATIFHTCELCSITWYEL
jgi:hypothetical protein